MENDDTKYCFLENVCYLCFKQEQLSASGVREIDLLSLERAILSDPDLIIFVLVLMINSLNFVV